MNDRKNKILLNLWLTQSELISMNALMRKKNEYFEEVVAEIIETAYKRGDLQRR